jgi:tripartite-type tricarboxylate transporter receptor subunit TctC
MGAPKKTPPEIIDKLNQEINAGLADPSINARLAALGGTAFRESPADLAKFVLAQTEERARLIRATKIKPE